MGVSRSVCVWGEEQQKMQNERLCGTVRKFSSCRLTCREPPRPGFGLSTWQPRPPPIIRQQVLPALPLTHRVSESLRGSTGLSRCVCTCMGGQIRSTWLSPPALKACAAEGPPKGYSLGGTSKNPTQLNIAFPKGQGSPVGCRCCSATSLCSNGAL